MKSFSKSKKGEMTTQQIVVLIILIISFAIILFFLLKLGLGQKSEAEVCHNSVVTRGNSMVPTDSYPLNCKRSYVCITEDGTCEKMLDPIKEKVKTKDDVYKVLADEMANCWWIFGEGNVNYVGEETIPKLHCSICSQLTFDNSLYEGKTPIFSSNSFPKKELYDYLEKTNYSETQNYLSYLKKVNKVNEITSQDFGNINLKDSYYVFMGRVADLNAIGWGAGIVTGATALILWAIPGANVGMAALTFAAASGAGAGFYYGGYLSSIYTNAVSGETFIYPDIVSVNSGKWEELHCDVIDTTN